MLCLVGAVMGPHKVQDRRVKIRAVGRGSVGCPLRKGTGPGGRLGTWDLKSAFILLANTYTLVLAASAQRKRCLSVIPHPEGASFSIVLKASEMIALGLIIMKTYLVN